MSTVPTIPDLGTVVLTALGVGADVRLTTDPDTYQLIWPKRQKKEQVIGGVSTLEWGKLARDAVVHAQSGPSQWLNPDVVRAMDYNDGLIGEQWRLEDFEGNDFIVRIEKWEPVKTKGLPYYEYTLDLEVLSMAVLRGAVYTGD